MFSIMCEMSLQGSQNGLGEGVIDSLMSFFTDPGDWAYVMDYDRFGVVSAMVTHTEDGSVLSSLLKGKRIVVELKNGEMFSVIRLATTPVGMWEACQLEITGDGLISDRGYYDTSELFELFSRHASKP